MGSRRSRRIHKKSGKHYLRNNSLDDNSSISDESSSLMSSGSSQTRWSHSSVSGTESGSSSETESSGDYKKYKRKKRTSHHIHRHHHRERIHTPKLQSTELVGQSVAVYDIKNPTSSSTNELEQFWKDLGGGNTLQSVDKTQDFTANSNTIHQLRDEIEILKQQIHHPKPAQQEEQTFEMSKLQEKIELLEQECRSKDDLIDALRMQPEEPDHFAGKPEYESFSHPHSPQHDLFEEKPQLAQKKPEATFEQSTSEQIETSHGENDRFKPTSHVHKKCEECDEHHRTIQSLRDEIERLNRRNDDLVHETSELKRQLSNDVANIQLIERQMSIAHQDVQKLTNELSAMRMERDNLRDEAGDLRTANSSMKQQIQKLTTRVQDLHNQLRTTRQAPRPAAASEHVSSFPVDNTANVRASQQHQSSGITHNQQYGRFSQQRVPEQNELWKTTNEPYATAKNSMNSSLQLGASSTIQTAHSKLSPSGDSPVIHGTIPFQGQNFVSTYATSTSPTGMRPPQPVQSNNLHITQQSNMTHDVKGISNPQNMSSVSDATINVNHDASEWQRRADMLRKIRGGNDAHPQNREQPPANPTSNPPMTTATDFIAMQAAARRREQERSQHVNETLERELSAPFATTASAQADANASAKKEQQLLALNLRRGQLLSELDKLGPAQPRSIAERRRKQQCESELNDVENEISQVRSWLRRFEAQQRR